MKAVFWGLDDEVTGQRLVYQVVEVEDISEIGDAIQSFFDTWQGKEWLTLNKPTTFVK